MRMVELKLIIKYLHRFVEGPIFSKQKWVSLWRYTGMVMSLVKEKIYGVDYTMVYQTKEESDCHHSVYTKVPQKVLKRILADIEEPKKYAFMDVGCGKGYAISFAAKHGFIKAGGIEYAPFLYDTCIKNLKKEKLSTEYTYHGDAREFEYYGDFEIFFMNNPFDETILASVTKKIYETHQDKVCYIYYLNPVDEARTQAIEHAGFEFIKRIKDPYEWYFDVNVYKNMNEKVKV